MSRVRGFARYNPRQPAQDLISSVCNVLEDLENYLPLTLRQIFYRLVAIDIIGKTETDYSKLAEICNRARRAKMIPFDAIRDDGPVVSSGYDFIDEQELIEYVIDICAEARLDLQRYQECRIELWCEAAGMVPQLERVACPFGIGVVSSGGFDSTTVKHEFGRKYAESYTIVLHIGDYDPSGVHIYQSLAEDVQAFARAFGGRVEFSRIAVTPEQIDSLQLQTSPPKASDNRKFDDDRTVQCEAIDPPDLARIIKSAILDRVDVAELRRATEWQREIRERIYERVAELGE